jgi:lipopolysaccharide transport system ATP-binding protein
MSADTRRREEHRYGDGAVKIMSFEIRTLDGSPAKLLHSLHDYELVVAIRAFKAVTDVCYGLILRDRRGLDLFGWDTSSCCKWCIRNLAAGETHRSFVRFTVNLAAGTYFLSLSLARLDGHKHDVRFDALQMDVHPTPNAYTASIVNLNVREPVLESSRQSPLGTSNGEVDDERSCGTDGKIREFTDILRQR